MMIINTIILATITNALVTAFVGLLIASIIGYFIAWMIKKMKIKALKQKLKDRQNTITDLLDKKDALGAHSNNLEMLVAQNEKYVKKQKKKAKDFERKCNVLYDDNVDLKRSLEDALDRNGDMSEDLKSWTAKNQDLKQQNQDLNRQCVDLKKDADIIPNLKNEISSLKKEAGIIPNLKDEISSLKKEADVIPNLKDEISSLKKEGEKIPSLQSQLDALLKDVNDHKSDIITKDIVIDDLKNKLKQSEEDLSGLKRLIDESNDNALSLNTWLVENE